MSQCLRLNRPCVIKGLALDSVAYKEWGFERLPNDYSKKDATEEAYAYLTGKIGEKDVKVYEEVKPDIPFTNPAFNNFREISAKN